MLLKARRAARQQGQAAILALLAIAVVAGPAEARDVIEAKVAVAANFTAPAKEIVAAFEKAEGHRIILSFGSTGQLFAQITQAAPFDVFLAADQKTPKKTVDEGHGVPDSRFTYAVGKLVLFRAAWRRTFGPGQIGAMLMLLSARVDRKANLG